MSGEVYSNLGIYKFAYWDDLRQNKIHKVSDFIAGHFLP